eukprot:UN11831
MGCEYSEPPELTSNADDRTIDMEEKEHLDVFVSVLNSPQGGYQDLGIISATYAHRFGMNTQAGQPQMTYEQRLAFGTDKVRGLCLAKLRKKCKERKGGNAVFGVTFDVELHHSMKICVATGSAVRMNNPPQQIRIIQQPQQALQTESAPPYNPPQEILPSGWSKGVANDGRIFYKNAITKTTQWQKPLDEATNQ